VAVRVTPSYTAEIVTAVDALIADVVAVNVALAAPAATVAVAGTPAAAVLLLDSDTTLPPAGAALESVTLPCEVVPPVTLPGFTLTLCRLAGGGTGVTVSVAVLPVPP